MYSSDEVTAWLEEETGSGDHLRACDLVLAALEHGTASPEFTSQLRLCVSEYEFPKMLAALVDVMMPMESTCFRPEGDIAVLVRDVARRIREQYPPTDHYLPAVMAAVDRMDP
jgi:hypothetical protein